MWPFVIKSHTFSSACSATQQLDVPVHVCITEIHVHNTMTRIQTLSVYTCVLSVHKTLSSPLNETI